MKHKAARLFLLIFLVIAVSLSGCNQVDEKAEGRSRKTLFDSNYKLPDREPTETIAPTETPAPTNTLVPTQEPTPELSLEHIDLKGYDFAEVCDYFRDIVLHSEYGGSTDETNIRKWDSPISCYIFGTLSDSDRDVLNRLFNALNQVTGFPGIEEITEESNANLVIRFLPIDEYQPRAIERIGDEYTDGYATAWYIDDVYTEGEIGICTDVEQFTRTSVILEETIQVLGLLNDSYTYPDSLFYQGFNTPQWPTDLDWLLVELLYRPEITCGMTGSEAIAIYEQLVSPLSSNVKD